MPLNKKPNFAARLLPKALYRYLANFWIRRSSSVQVHADAAAARQAVGQVDREWRARIDDVLSCPDLPRIPKVAGAGTLRDGLIMMHNGIEVGALGYYGAGIMNMLMESGGVHEPQEEFVFGELLPLLPARPVMLEMGAYWSFYSLWLAKSCPGARNFLIEPDYANLLSGQVNFRRYGMTACFEQAYVSDKVGWTRDRVRRVTLDAFCRRQGLEHITVLHSDIQGAEVQMLTGARRMLGERRVDYVFLSTHSHELHEECVRRLLDFGYLVPVSVDLDASFSFDGLIVAYRPEALFPANLQVSLKSRRPPRIPLNMSNAPKSSFMDKLFLNRRLHVSQAGQDYWVYGEVFDEKRRGFFLDVGAHDGLQLSNTFLLEKRYKWSGICVEGNPETFKKLEAHRSCSCVNACLDSESSEVMFAKRGVLGGIVASDTDNREADAGDLIRVRTRTLESVLKEHNAPREIDYLSIDIEGAEDRVLLGFDFDRYLFRAITIERPSRRLREVLSAKGYILIKELPGLDCFYIHSSFSEIYTRNFYAYHRRKHVLWRRRREKY